MAPIRGKPGRDACFALWHRSWSRLRREVDRKVSCLVCSDNSLVVYELSATMTVPALSNNLVGRGHVNRNSVLWFGQLALVGLVSFGITPADAATRKPVRKATAASTTKRVYSASRAQTRKAT